MEILPICRVLEILCIDVFGVYDMHTLVMYNLYPLRSCLNIYASYVCGNDLVT